MEWEHMEAELATIAERLGIDIRHIRYEGEGGLCMIRGKRVLIINDCLAAPDRVSVMAKAIATVPEVETMHILPEVRELIERYAAETPEP